VLDDKILEKPNSPEDAFNMLTSLSNRKHVVYSGVCFLLPKVKGLTCFFVMLPDSSVWVLGSDNQPFIHSFSEETEVHFSALTPEMIRAYVDSGSPM
jgi:septum formation protein